MLVEVEDDQDPVLTTKLSEHGHANGKAIKVHIFKDEGKGGHSSGLSSEDKFLKKIPMMKRS